MTTNEQTRHRVEVTGIGKTKAGRLDLSCKPWFRSNYPLHVYPKEGEGLDIKIGDFITVQKGNLKDEKNKSMDWGYYWDLVAGALPQPPLETPIGGKPPEETPLDAGPAEGPFPFMQKPGSYILEGRDLGIMRQVALKEMNAWAIECLRAGVRLEEAERVAKFQENMRLLVEGQ